MALFLSQRRKGAQSSLFILETCQCVFIFMVTSTDFGYEIKKATLR